MYTHGELGPMLGNQRQSPIAATRYQQPDATAQIESWRRGASLAQTWISALIDAAQTGQPMDRFIGGKTVRVTKNPTALKSWRAYLAHTQAKLKAATQS